MSEPTLFPLPEPTKPERKPFQVTQRYTCKRCKHSVHCEKDDFGDAAIYCHKHDLCLYHGKDAECRLVKDDYPIECSGDAWGYKEAKQ